MTTYTYIIKNISGTSRKGRIEAESRDDAASTIKKDGFFVVELKEEGAGARWPFLKKSEKLSSFEKINFTDHMASLIKAGAPIREALEAYAEDGDKRSVMIDSIIKTIEQGKKLSEAFRRFPKTYSPLYISLIKAGEMAGNLDETLAYLANELRREHEFKQRVKSALFYPTLVLSVAFLVISLIVVVVVPKITEITKNIGGDIPATTRFIIATTDYLNDFAPLLFVIFGLFVFLLISAFKLEKTRDKVSSYLLRTPMVGGIIKKYTLARFLRIIGSSVKYGIPLTAAFDSAEEVVGNLEYKKACRKMSKMIEKGNSLSESFVAQGVELFPGLISRTVRGAEKTGGVDKALDRLSTQFETEVDRELKRLTELIEPVLVVVLGIIVLGIAISVIAPIYQMTSRIK